MPLQALSEATRSLPLAGCECVMTGGLKLGELAESTHFGAADYRNGLFVLANLRHRIGCRPSEPVPSQVRATAAQIVAPHRPVRHAKRDRGAVGRRRGLGDAAGGEADRR